MPRDKGLAYDLPKRARPLILSQTMTALRLPALKRLLNPSKIRGRACRPAPFAEQSATSHALTASSVRMKRIHRALRVEDAYRLRESCGQHFILKERNQICFFRINKGEPRRRCQLFRTVSAAIEGDNRNSQLPFRQSGQEFTIRLTRQRVSTSTWLRKWLSKSHARSWKRAAKE